MTNNIRRKNGYRRDQIRKYLLRTQDVCAICGQPIDKSLKCPHPGSPEVDEIIPVSKGGSPIDINNCQLVHRACNRAKSNRIEFRVYQVPTNERIEHSREW